MIRVQQNRCLCSCTYIFCTSTLYQLCTLCTSVNRTRLISNKIPRTSVITTRSATIRTAILWMLPPTADARNHGAPPQLQVHPLPFPTHRQRRTSPGSWSASPGSASGEQSRVLRTRDNESACHCARRQRGQGHNQSLRKAEHGERGG